MGGHVALCSRALPGGVSLPPMRGLAGASHPPLPNPFLLSSLCHGSVQRKSLEAEIGEFEAGADEEFQELEEKAEKAEEEAKQLQRKVEALEVRRGDLLVLDLGAARKGWGTGE